MPRLARILTALLCAMSLAHSDMLDDKVQELIGADAYAQNKNFINTIFASRARFYTNANTLNVGAIAYALKNNGLLILKFSSPMELRISFSSQASPMALSYTLNALLSSMGYSYFMPSQASKSNGTATITYTLVTEHAIDPIILYQELQKRGFLLQDITRKAINDWGYVIKAQNMQIFNAKPLSIGASLALREVSGQYWLSLPRSGVLNISANPKWTPRIISYDRNLHIIQTIIEKNPKPSFSVRLDSASAFVMITDAQNPDAIKQIEIRLAP